MINNNRMKLFGRIFVKERKDPFLVKEWNLNA